MKTPNAVPAKAAAYGRTSSDDEEDKGDGRGKASIAEQLTACRNYCGKNGWTVAGEFHDRNRSGRTYPTCGYFRR